MEKRGGATINPNYFFAFPRPIEVYFLSFFFLPLSYPDPFVLIMQENMQEEIEMKSGSNVRTGQVASGNNVYEGDTFRQKQQLEVSNYHSISPFQALML